MKGPGRLFMEGSRNEDDVDNMADANHNAVMENDRQMITHEDVANSSMEASYQTKTHMASASQESREVFVAARIDHEITIIIIIIWEYQQVKIGTLLTIQY